MFSTKPHCTKHKWLVYTWPDNPCRECIKCGRIEWDLEEIARG